GRCVYAAAALQERKLPRKLERAPEFRRPSEEDPLGCSLNLWRSDAFASVGIIVKFLLQLEDETIPALVPHGAGPRPSVGSEAKVAEVADHRLAGHACL